MRIRSNLIKYSILYNCIYKLYANNTQSLRIGTRISDIFNSRLSDSYDFEKSFYQQYLVENLGFDINLLKGYNNSKMPSDSNILALRLRVESGWEGFDDISDSNFWALKNQWIVFYGDKMLENIFQDYLTVFTGC